MGNDPCIEIGVWGVIHGDIAYVVGGNDNVGKLTGMDRWLDGDYVVLVMAMLLVPVVG